MGTADLILALEYVERGAKQKLPTVSCSRSQPEPQGVMWNLTALVAANLGVNPSLTITALAERAMEFLPLASENTWNDRA